MRIWPAALVALILAFFWSSHLSLFPVPWPDDPAFYLAGADLTQWPPQFLMRSQAHYLPSYADANFQLMPGFPALLALGKILGIEGNHAIKLWGFLLFGVYLWALARLCIRLGFDRKWVWAIVLCALFSPQLRWSVGVVRPEVLQGVLWVSILYHLSSEHLDRSRIWDISWLLAIAAWFHFNAIVWVAPLALALYPWEAASRPFLRWLARLWAVGWRVALYLSPWLVYVGLKWDDFLMQMEPQFTRLGGSNPFITSIRSFMDSVFLSTGNPVEHPKLFNPAKVLFWVLGMAALLLLLRKIFSSQTLAHKKRLITAAAAAWVGTLVLWEIKYEIWFSSLVHYAFYPLLAIGVSCLAAQAKLERIKNAVYVLVVILGVFHLATTAWQWKETRHTVRWEQHQSWSRCIEETLEKSGARVVWQPHWPDVLVNLHRTSPDREYYRTVDYYHVDQLLDRFSKRTDAVIHTLLLGHRDPEAQSRYEGPLRERDRKILLEHPWLAYPKYSSLRSKDRNKIQICQEGAFWAAVSYRKR